MNKKPQPQKLYAFLDESGQDYKSPVFIVVAVVTDSELAIFRSKLLVIEKLAKTGRRKWHKSKPERRLGYLKQVLDAKIGQDEVFYGEYPKPLPFFFPMLEVLEKAILTKAQSNYRSTIYIDGIDKKKAQELTNALRIKGLRVNFIKSVRDEAEPLIRLADMWAGCIRQACLGGRDEKVLLSRGLVKKCLSNIKTPASP